MSGLASYHGGLAAEDQVVQHYARRGIEVVIRRWRGTRGEIDLIARHGGEVIFIEVKSSRTHDAAMAHLSPAQIVRICETATEFLAGEPNGQLTDIRIDVALVDGRGRIEIVENAFAG
jgi:putative endonuclease